MYAPYFLIFFLVHVMQNVAKTVLYFIISRFYTFSYRNVYIIIIYPKHRFFSFIYIICKETIFHEVCSIKTRPIREIKSRRGLVKMRLFQFSISLMRSILMMPPILIEELFKCPCVKSLGVLPMSKMHTCILVASILFQNHSIIISK